MVLVVLGLLALLLLLNLLVLAAERRERPPARVAWEPAHDQHGTVVTWREEDGYGLIKPYPGMQYAWPWGVFVFRSGLRPPLARLEPGQHVRYRVPAGGHGEGGWGPVAVDVEVLP